jgi:glycosyltransferase involved in cell wall biosynthesis
MSVAEAMAAGLPVICCGVGALTDIVRDGVNGHIVAFGDVSGLCGAIGDLLDNPRVSQQMGRNNRDWARQHSWQDVGERFCGICGEVVATREAASSATRKRLKSLGVNAG